MDDLQKYEIAAFGVLERELEAAKVKHPGFAADLGDAMSLLGEEYGETCKAVNEHRWEGKSLEQVIVEAGQTAAVAIRLICMAMRMQEAANGN